MKSSAFCKAAGALCAAALCFTGCFGALPTDMSYFDKFVSQVFPKPEKALLSDTVDLYVDYSTCVAEAANSEFFKATHPAIVDCNPNYYAIKGKQITLETSDRNEVYRLLRSIREINNADLDQAVKNITHSNNQSVLITDGEYFPNNIVKDNLDNPYLAPHIRTWLKAGHDIYIYSEPYRESNRFDKFRYYMIFTDRDMPNNLNDKFLRSAPDMEDVFVLHLGTGAPGVKFSKKFPDVNPTLSAIETPEIQKEVLVNIQLSWEDMKKYMTTGDLEQDYLVRGLYLDTRAEDGFRIKEIETKVYQLQGQYAEYADSAAVGGRLPEFDEDDFEEVDDVFEIDEKAFKKNGEIVLKLSDDFSMEDISDKHDNLFKVDFIVDDAEDNFSSNEDINAGFKWASISAAQNHAENTSVYQSIKQVLNDPKMNPEKDHALIYTLYIKTLAK